jgi:hypothetical protein
MRTIRPLPNLIAVLLSGVAFVASPGAALAQSPSPRACDAARRQGIALPNCPQPRARRSEQPVAREQAAPRSQPRRVRPPPRPAETRIAAPRESPALREPTGQCNSLFDQTSSARPQEQATGYRNFVRSCPGDHRAGEIVARYVALTQRQTSPQRGPPPRTRPPPRYPDESLPYGDDHAPYNVSGWNSVDARLRPGSVGNTGSGSQRSWGEVDSIDIDGEVGHPLVISAPSGTCPAGGVAEVGGERPVYGDSLPPGLALRADAAISGIPTQSGYWIVGMHVETWTCPGANFLYWGFSQEIRFHITGTGQAH